MDPRRKMFQLVVGDIINREIVTIDHFQTMSDAAAILDKHDISGAPVVDEVGKCIGIITSHDFVKYQSRQHHGTLESATNAYDSVDSSLSPLVQRDEIPFDRVYRHMTPAIQTISAGTKLCRASEIMCSEHIHRLVVLDESSRPVGMLTSLDIIATFWNLKVFRDHTAAE